MMKNTHFKIYACLFVFVTIGIAVSAQNNKECNYISSRYYHKVAQAELFWLEGNKEESYRVLSDLEKECVLLNANANWNELYYFAELCLEYKNYVKAIESIRSLIANYGFKLDDFTYRKMKKIPEWKNLKKELLILEKNFVPDTVLYNEINQMLEDDQYYRINASKIRKLMKDSTANIDSLAKVFSLRTPLLSIADIDNINYQKLLHIIDTKGFPLSPSIKYYRKERIRVYSAFTAMLIHFLVGIDSAKVNHLKPILLQYVKQGDCPPELLACLIGAYYSNISFERIFELEKLNERRKEIGLPDYDLSKQINAKREELSKAAQKKANRAKVFKKNVPLQHIKKKNP